MKNSRGITLVEAMVATALFAIVSAAIYSMIRDSRNALHFAVVFADRQANLALMNRVLQKDGQGSGMSFGNLLQDDDSGRRFYDFNPTCSANCERLLTLENAGDSLVMLTNGLKPLPSIPFDPAKAYQITAPVTPDMPGGLAFQSLNYNGYFESLAPGMWRRGNLFILYSPDPVPAYDASGEVNPAVAPRPLAYLGYVAADGASRLTAALPGVFDHEDPSGNAIPDEDSYLRRVQGIGGSTALVLAQPVFALRYVLRPRVGAVGEFTLVREIWGLDETLTPAFLTENVLMLEGVRSVVFRRKTIASTGLAFDIKMSFVKGN